MKITSHPTADRTVRLWLIKGDGKFFTDFYVKADKLCTAAARASDILAGSDTVEPWGGAGNWPSNVQGKRFYGTVEQHIVSIERTDIIVPA